MICKKYIKGKLYLSFQVIPPCVVILSIAWGKQGVSVVYVNYGKNIRKLSIRRI